MAAAPAAQHDYIEEMINRLHQGTREMLKAGPQWVAPPPKPKKVGENGAESRYWDEVAQGMKILWNDMPKFPDATAASAKAAAAPAAPAAVAKGDPTTTTTTTTTTVVTNGPPAAAAPAAPAAAATPKADPPPPPPPPPKVFETVWVFPDGFEFKPCPCNRCKRGLVAETARFLPIVPATPAEARLPTLPLDRNPGQAYCESCHDALWEERARKGFQARGYSDDDVNFLRPKAGETSVIKTVVEAPKKRGGKKYGAKKEGKKRKAAAAELPPSPVVTPPPPQVGVNWPMPCGGGGGKPPSKMRKRLMKRRNNSPRDLTLGW